MQTYCCPVCYKILEVWDQCRDTYHSYHLYKTNDEKVWWERISFFDEKAKLSFELLYTYKDSNLRFSINGKETNYSGFDYGHCFYPKNVEDIKNFLIMH